MKWILPWQARVRQWCWTPPHTHFMSARVALSAVAPVPLFVPEIGEWLAGREVSDETIRHAAEHGP